mmetsp:Transcript_7890/g.8698  ORF Transcript_7890/g.8698 Transcript_7890/m.8698 type:complete len:562 (+) Transcript_7890:195-1880(+)
MMAPLPLRRKCRIGILLYILTSAQVQSFIHTKISSMGWTLQHTAQHTTTVRTSATSFDDFEEFSQEFTSSSSSSSRSDEDIFAALRKRKEYLSSFGTSSSSTSSSGTEDSGRKLSQDELKTITNWKNADCVSTMRLQLDDWIRRIAIETFPLGVCGSANGSVYLVDLQNAETLDCVQNIHTAQIESEDGVVDKAMRKLYGSYDGSGIISLAIHNDIVVSSGREGGLQVFKIDGEEKDKYTGSRGGSVKSTHLHLKSEGMLYRLMSALVTSVAFDKSGLLWVASYDGFIRAFEYDDKEKPLVKQVKPVHEFHAGSEVLSVSVNDDVGCGVAATTSGEVMLFSLEDGEIMSRWKPFGNGVGRRKHEYARTAIIVQNDEGSNSENDVWSIVCGGSEGSMYQRRLNVDSMGYVSDRKPLIDDETVNLRLRQSHNKMVVSLSSPMPGLLVSGSQDSHIRIWDCSYSRSHEDIMIVDEDDIDIAEEADEEEEEAQFDDIGGTDYRPECLYALTGYKVWLGSIFTNGQKLVSDGADNTIIVHDFSGEDDSAGDFLFEDDDLEDFSDFD